MDSIETLRKRLQEAELKEGLSKKRCQYCEGVGWFEDTTYDRTGSWSRCSHCKATGLPTKTVGLLVAVALAPHVRPKPGEKGSSHE